MHSYSFLLQFKEHIKEKISIYIYINENNQEDIQKRNNETKTKNEPHSRHKTALINNSIKNNQTLIFDSLNFNITHHK